LLQLEQEKQDIYFDMLEKTESMEEKMMGTMEVKCTAVSCLQVLISKLCLLKECNTMFL